MNFSLENQLNCLNDSLYEASRFMQRDFSEIIHLQSSKKGIEDFIDKCYSRLQNKLMTALLKHRPKYGLILANQPLPKNCDYFFVIEPISGIANFQRSIPFCCMTVALFHQNQGKNEALAISIHNPILRETFYAAKTKGAWFENYNETSVPKSRMRVSNKNDLSDAVVSSIFSNESFIQNRNFGSNLLEIAYLAAGRLDIIIKTNHDFLVQAGLMLVREAGGYIEVKNNNFLACNEYLYKQASEVFQDIITENNL